MMGVITMSFDGVLMHHVIQELHETLRAGRISKIYQLHDFSFLFHIRREKTKHLLISPSPHNTRMHLTKGQYDKPMQPPLFCMFLRKHIEGARIEKITQHNNDRIALFTLNTTNELGDSVNRTLIYEALGKDGNLILVDDSDTILDCLNHTHPLEDRRTMIPGAKYHYPEDDRINPFDREKSKTLLATQRIDAPKALVEHFQGIGPLFATEWYQRRKDDGHETLMAMLEEKNYTMAKGKKIVFANIDLTHYRGEKTTFTSPSELIDHVFTDMMDKNRYNQEYKTLKQFIERQIKKQTRKIENLNKDLNANMQADENRIKGDLILSNQHKIKKGDRSVTLHDYEHQKDVNITLEPTKSPVENANRYFHAYKKQKKSLPHLKRQIVKSKNERTYFNLLESQLAHADLNDLEEIKEELQNYGYLKKRTGKKKQASRKAKPLRFIDDNGVEILVGKNNKQNGELTHKVADYNHVWFHVQSFQGSHVIVKTTWNNLTETTIRTAAHLAAYFSKMRHSSSVAVDYTEIRNIKKIPGQKPCFVTYTKQKTIYIDPDETFIKTLKQPK